MGISRSEKYATGLFSAWVFDAPLSDIVRYEVAVRRVDRRASFKSVSLKAGQYAQAAPLIDSGPGTIPYDSALSKLFYAIGDRLEDGDIPAAAKTCDTVLDQARARWSQLQAKNSPHLFVVDHALPVLMPLRDALHKNDLPTAASLLESSNGSGIRLLNGMQTLGLYTTAPQEK